MSEEVVFGPQTAEEDRGDTNWGMIGNITVALGAIFFLTGVYVLGKGNAQSECNDGNKWADSNITTGRVLLIIGFILLIVGIILKVID